MKTLQLLLLLMTFSSMLFANYSKPVNEQIYQKKYQNAWNLLQKNSSDSSVENIINKVDFCLNYFTHTAYHQKFSFKNLTNSESLLSHRKRPITDSVVFENFNPEKELLKARKRFPNKPEINLALGNYYYRVFVTYKSEWIKSKKELSALFYYHYLEAYKQNLKTAESIYSLGLYHLNMRSYNKAKSYLIEAVAADSTYAPANYNLAYSYSIEKKLDSAIYHAQKAYDHYEIDKLKADAASMVGIILSDKKQYEDAINWLLTSDALAPGNFYVYEYLLIAYLNLNKMAEANLICKNLYYYDYKSPRIFNSIINAYSDLKKQAALQSFLKEELVLKPHDKEYQGFVNIHLCQLLMRMDLNDEAKIHLDQAEQSFKTAYDSDHGVFKVIDHLNQSLTTN